MADQFVAEIRIFGGNFAPTGWAFCDGQILPISQNTALFSLLGTTYGGDGRSTFALPDLRGRSPLHQGQGPGLTSRPLGESAGVETVVLTQSQIPVHTHTLAGGGAAASTNPSGNVFGTPASAKIYGSATSMVPMSSAAIGPAGQNQAHDNRQPYLALSFIIALQGIFPPRS
jgi:microcystin-dependent protein